MGTLGNEPAAVVRLTEMERKRSHEGGARRIQERRLKHRYIVPFFVVFVVVVEKPTGCLISRLSPAATATATAAFDT